MGSKNIKPLINIAKEHGPAVGKFLYKNAGEIKEALTSAQGVKNKIAEKKKNKTGEEKVHLRKERYDEFSKRIIKNLDQCDRRELHDYKLEVTEFIRQIDTEMSKETKAKKPLHIKRRKNWEALLVQIDGKLKTKDYREYLRIYNDDEYSSTYFGGFERNIKEFKKLIEKADADEIMDFLASQTQMDSAIIRKDFL